MVDYTYTERTKAPFDSVKIVKCVVPITGHEQRYRMTVSSYRDDKIMSFVMSKAELESLKLQIKELDE